MNKIKTWIKYFFIFYNFIYNNIIFRVYNVKFKSFNFCGKIFIRNSGSISIGENFKFNSGINCNPIGGDTICRLISTNKGNIIIGNNVGISNSTIWSNKQIVIEDNVLIGGSCKLWDTDFHSIDFNLRNTKHDSGNVKPILVKKNVFIGASSIVLKGVTIGENSIIAANSLVSKNIPANEIWGGNPIKFIKNLNSSN